MPCWLSAISNMWNVSEIPTSFFMDFSFSNSVLFEILILKLINTLSYDYNSFTFWYLFWVLIDPLPRDVVPGIENHLLNIAMFISVIIFSICLRSVVCLQWWWCFNMSGRLKLSYDMMCIFWAELYNLLSNFVVFT